MSAAEYVGSTSLLAAALLTAFVGLRRGRKEAGGALPLLLFYLFVCAAIYTYLNYRVDPNPKRALSWYYCTLSLKSFAMVFLMIFALTYTNPFFKPRLHFITALLIIPLITLILCLHGQNQNLLFKMLEIPQIYPNKSLSAVRGVWFYINTFYGYACLAALLFLFYIHYKRSSVIYKWQSSIFMLGASLFALLDLESVFFGGSESASILGLVVMSVLLHVAYLYFKASDLAFIANEAVFEKISSIALVVENDGKILSMNHMARKTFSFFGGKA
ncbi:MAG: hypothetical protein LBT44_01205, partial [Clostridiales bacterium]|nr:hypothetical protein [Clostridiales bacterium]